MNISLAVFVILIIIAVTSSMVANQYLKLRGRAIITCNVDLVFPQNRDIAGVCTEAVVEGRLFLELQGHTGLPSGNVHHFLNLDHVAHQRQIIKIHPRGKTSEELFSLLC